MVSQIFDESPKEMQLISSDDESHAIKQVNSVEKVQMRKQLGLLEGVAIILGIICGSGKNVPKIFNISLHVYIK